MPPGRSTRATSASSWSPSATNCSAPKEEKTTSRQSSAKGSRLAVAHTDGHRGAGRLVDAAGVLQLALADVEAEGDRALAAQPARALAGAAADLEHALQPGDVAEDAEVGLLVALGAPDEADVAEEVAVGGLVLVGVGVPLAPVGAQGLGLRDGPAGRVDAVRQFGHP